MILATRAGERLRDMESLAIEHDLRDQITAMIEASGSQKAAAQELGFSGTFLHDVLHGRAAVSENLALALGWEKLIVFVRRAEDLADEALLDYDGLPDCFGQWDSACGSETCEICAFEED